MENTAKNFALQLGSLITLYASITALITLLFGIITVAYPDSAQEYWEYDSASSTIRFGIALLLVFFPAYLILTRTVNRIRRSEQGTYLALTRWLVYLSLVVGGAVLLGDLVVLINGFLNGELTIRFVLKALSMFVIVSSAFIYYLFDARGYWQNHERKSIQYAGVMTLVVVATLVLGFRHTETPSEVREQKIDAEQIADLELIQSYIMSYYAQNASLPKSMEIAFDGLEMPVPSAERSAYEYTLTSTSTFSLCAEFVYPTNISQQMQYSQPIIDEKGALKNAYDWNHTAGTSCFERVLNI